MSKSSYFAALTFSTSLAASLLPQIGRADDVETQQVDDGVRILRFDVSENAKRFIFDETPMTHNKDGKEVPGDGNEFKTEGYIYQADTLKGDGDGVNPDGSPQYPEQVIGHWYCWGFHVGNGGATETGPWVITQQLYDFDDTPGRRSLTSAGLELVDIDVPIKRAITGGTGRYDEARGEVVQKTATVNIVVASTLYATSRNAFFSAGLFNHTVFGNDQSRMFLLQRPGCLARACS